MGKLTAIYGPMFAGKTTELQSICNNAINNGKRVLMVKYIHDNRYSSSSTIINHNGDSIEPRQGLDIIQIDNIADIIDIINLDKYNLSTLDLLIIDEVQFYPHIANTISLLTTNDKYTHLDIVLAGLDLDAQCQTFNTQFNHLIATADTAIYKLAKCYICQSTAMYTTRTDITTLDIPDRIKIAGPNTYQPVCTSHHPYFH